MSLLGNIIWLVFGGFLSGVGYILGGISTCLTIIGIPFGIATIQIGIASFTPFGRQIKKGPEADSTLVLILSPINAFLVCAGVPQGFSLELCDVQRRLHA